MSGGVSNVTVENLLVWNSRRAVRIKTSPGRGGYVQHINYRNLTFDNVRVGIVIKTDYNEHPDDGFDPKALPILEDISFTGVHGQGVRVPVRIHGSEEIPVKKVTFRDMSVGITYKKKHIFQCAYVEGRVIGTVFPAPCENLDRYDEQEQLIKHSKSQNVTDIDYDFWWSSGLSFSAACLLGCQWLLRLCRSPGCNQLEQLILLLCFSSFFSFFFLFCSLLPFFHLLISMDFVYKENI